MPVAASKTSGTLVDTGEGVWRFQGWGSPWITAGVTDRRVTAADLLTRLGPSAPTRRSLASGLAGVAEAEQVHGGSIAMVERSEVLPAPIAGCDALMTGLPGMALLIRTADCLPIFVADPSRGVVGLAHAGWRGIAASLPLRLIAAFRHTYHSRPEEMHVAIGPAIRACCYEIGPEFADRFEPFVQETGGRRTCDLVGAAIEQLQRSGVRSDRIADSRRCTACESQHWFSLRREGQHTGRLISFILVRR